MRAAPSDGPAAAVATVAADHVTTIATSTRLAGTRAASQPPAICVSE